MVTAGCGGEVHLPCMHSGSCAVSPICSDRLRSSLKEDPLMWQFAFFFEKVNIYAWVHNFLFHLKIKTEKGNNNEAIQQHEQTNELTHWKPFPFWVLHCGNMAEE